MRRGLYRCGCAVTKWSERRDHCAWENPDWRTKMVNAQAKGYDPRIWALLAYCGLLECTEEIPQKTRENAS